MVARADKVHPGRVQRVAVRVFDGPVHRAVAAHVGVPVAIAEQQRVSLPIRRHPAPDPVLEGPARRIDCHCLEWMVGTGRLLQRSDEDVVVQRMNRARRKVLG